MSETGESAGVEPSPPPTAQVEGSSPLDPEAPPTAGPLSSSPATAAPPPVPPVPPVPPTPAAGTPPPPPTGARRRWAGPLLAGVAGFVLGALVLGAFGLALREHRRDRFADVRGRIDDVRDRWRDGDVRGRDDDRQSPATGMPGSGMPGSRSGSGATGPTVIEGRGPNGEDVVVWPDGRTVTLPASGATTPGSTTTQPS